MKKILIIVCAILISTSFIYAQDLKIREKATQEQGKIKIEVKDSLAPDIYIDGTKYDQKIFSMLDPERIESITVLKGEAAIKEYDAPNGVLLITSKNDNQNDTNTKIKIRATGNTDNKTPVIVIDGKVSSQEELSKLSSLDVESIEVKKDEKTMEEYNAPNGVIVVKTKKKKE